MLNCVPVHIRSSLLHHGLLSFHDLLGVEDVEEVDRHVERHRDVLPHGVGHLILRVDHGVLTREGKDHDRFINYFLNSSFFHKMTENSEECPF